MTALAFAYVGVGGAIGAMARFGLVALIGRFSAGTFPYGTLVVNIMGALMLGMFVVAIANWLPARAKDMHLLFAVGLLGGFTTFSAFSFDLFTLYADKLWLQATIYAIGSVVLSVLALMTGMLIANKVFGG